MRGTCSWLDQKKNSFAQCALHPVIQFPDHFFSQLMVHSFLSCFLVYCVCMCVRACVLACICDRVNRANHTACSRLLTRHTDLLPAEDSNRARRLPVRDDSNDPLELVSKPNQPRLGAETRDQFSRGASRPAASLGGSTAASVSRDRSRNENQPHFPKSPARPAISGQTQVRQPERRGHSAK